MNFPFFQLSAISSEKRKRRHRTIFTECQLYTMEEAFISCQYPDVQMRENLADKLKLREERVERFDPFTWRQLFFALKKTGSKKFIRISFTFVAIAKLCLRRTMAIAECFHGNCSNRADRTIKKATTTQYPTAFNAENKFR
ncbi:hypothetical protein niasHT_014731 [Heterodera trifolii]|uniref:Homeobox domain-containing protein n=1 Tax=Heterodera trifolii TaxID=157864 RepID=A0ABD2KXG7_9BILA